jgi:hypothetical protein
MREANAWADQTFGDAILGDERRRRRLVRMAAGLCARPAGRLTRVYSEGAEREGAFRLVENDAVNPAEIARASHRATARRCASEAIVWGAITAAVAARAEHLKLLSRAEPDRDAELELSRDEIDAAIILTKTKRHRIADNLTLQQAVWLIAQVGGYTGKSSGGPPGAQTIARGLQFVAPAAAVLAATRSG